MRVVVLGIGGWVSNPLFGHTSILVSDSNEAEYVLLDSGEGAYRSMYKCGYADLRKLKAIVLTHSHGDHILGLPTLVQIAKLVGAKFKVLGLKETLNSVIEILRATSVSNFECCVELVPVEPGDIAEIGGFRAAFSEASHSVPSIAVKVEEDISGKCLTYSGDTSFSEQVVKLAQGCDLLIHEVSFSDSESMLAKSLGHSTLLDCIRVATEAGNKFVLPIHFGQKEPRLDPDSLPRGMTFLYPEECLLIDI